MDLTGKSIIKERLGFSTKPSYFLCRYNKIMAVKHGHSPRKAKQPRNKSSSPNAKGKRSRSSQGNRKHSPTKQKKLNKKGNRSSSRSSSPQRATKKDVSSKRSQSFQSHRNERKGQELHGQREKDSERRSFMEHMSSQRTARGVALWTKWMNPMGKKICI